MLVAGCQDRRRAAPAAQAFDVQRAVADDPGFAESVRGRAVLAALERGDPAALASYSRLHSTANVEWTEDVDYSVAIALTHNPQGVLAMADTPEKYETFCQSPLIEPTARVERDFVRAALKALRAIRRDSPVAGRRDACVKRLRGV